MKIKVLGTRGEIHASAPYHSKKSGVLIDNKLLLDIGDKRFLAYKPKAILITHLHPDHAYFVRRNELPETSIPMYAPEQYHDCMHLARRAFKLDDYKIKPIPTVHSAKILSQAYLIEHNGIRLLYTGDMICIEKKYRRLLNNLDMVITESSFYRKGGMIRREKYSGKVYGHAGIPNLINFFKKYTSTILFVHFGTWFYEDMKDARQRFQELAKEHNLNIIVGYDGLELDL